MQGVLAKYGPRAANLAFISSPAPPAPAPAAPPQPTRHLVLVGGLTDGLLGLPYAQQLSAAAARLGWCLVQAQLSSSYVGWGLASLDDDAVELRMLSEYLSREHGSSCWVLMGHSTGCQDAVRYVQRFRAKDPRLAGVILQAPVSDREFLTSDPANAAWPDAVPAARQAVAQGRGDDIVFCASAWDGAAISARRLVSLCCPGGDDDMFSTDLSDVQLQAILGPLQALHGGVLILQSGADEAVPQGLRAAAVLLGQRMLKVVQGGAGSGGVSVSKQPVHIVRVLEGAPHACGGGHEGQLVEAVCEWLQQLQV